MPEDEATSAKAPPAQPAKASPTEATEPELATQPEAPAEDELPREQQANISVDKEEEKATAPHPPVSAPMPNMVDDAQLALNQAAMVSNAGESQEGKDILLAADSRIDRFTSPDGSFPDITAKGTWVTTEEAETAELAAHRSGVKLYRMEG